MSARWIRGCRASSTSSRRNRAKKRATAGKIIAHLTPHDEIKFVLASRADYDWAREVIRAQNLTAICPVLLSPVQGELPPAQLAEWVLADRLPVRMQVQLHKILWGNTPGT